jgi:hypothetical protein
VLRRFAMQSTRNRVDSFWVAIITGITTQEWLRNRHRTGTRANKSSNSDPNSLPTGLKGADCPRNRAATLHLVTAMLGLGLCGADALVRAGPPVRLLRRRPPYFNSAAI